MAKIALLFCMVALALAQPERPAPTGYGNAPPAPIYTSSAPPAPIYTSAPPAPIYTSSAPPAPIYTSPAPPAPIYTSVPPAPIYGSSAPPAPIYRSSPPSYEDEHPKGRPFSFSYEVKDPYQNLDFGHNSNSDGNVVTGQYHVLLPDGRIQTVTYTADHYNGYQAEVRYEGEAIYPEPQPYKPRTPSYAPPTPSYSTPQYYTPSYNTP